MIQKCGASAIQCFTFHLGRKAKEPLPLEAALLNIFIIYLKSLRKWSEKAVLAVHDTVLLAIPVHVNSSVHPSIIC